MGRLMVGVMIVTVLATAAHGQAFGVQMGDPVSKYGVKTVRSSTQALLRNVPNPHSEFEDYLVFHAPGVGICQVVGVGIDHPGDATGDDVRASYNALKKDLAAKYGGGKSSEQLMDGALWHGEREWAVSLQRERTHETIWTAEVGSRLPREVRAIELLVRATDPSTTYVQLTFEFTNFAACKSVSDAEDKKGL